MKRIYISVFSIGLALLLPSWGQCGGPKFRKMKKPKTGVVHVERAVERATSRSIGSLRHQEHPLPQTSHHVRSHVVSGSSLSHRPKELELNLPLTRMAKLEESLSPRLYPSLAGRDAALHLKTIAKEDKILANLEKNEKAFYRSLRQESYEGTVPYYQYIPQGLDYVFIGESHTLQLGIVSNVQEEIIRMIQTIKQQNSTRKIVVAFEHLYDTHLKVGLDNHTPLALAHNAEELAKLTQGNQFNLAVVEAAQKMGLDILGLDPRNQLGELARLETKNPHLSLMSDEYVDLSRSYVGFDYRHQKWVEHLQDLRAQEGYEDALVVVVSGAAHVSKYAVNSLSAMLPGKSATFFVVKRSVTEATTPVLEALSRDFPKNKTTVISFKKDQIQEAATLESYVDMLGCDGAVVVPD